MKDIIRIVDWEGHPVGAAFFGSFSPTTGMVLARNPQERHKTMLDGDRLFITEEGLVYECAEDR